MRVFISPQIVNIPYVHHIFMKSYTWCSNYLRRYEINDLAQGSKKGDELLSQKNEQEMTVPYLKNKTLLLGGKSIYLYDERESNNPQDCIPSYDVGIR